MNRLKQFISNLGRVPAVPLAGFPGIQLTRTSVRENLFDSRTQVESLLALYEAIQPDALFTMMDLTVEAEFLGCRLTITDDDPPAVAAPALKDGQSIAEFFKNKTVGGRMPLFAEAVRRLKRALDVPVCAYVIGPLTLTGEIMDLVHVMKAIRRNPDQLHRVLSKSTELILQYAALLEDAGADLICVLEPSAMMISAVQFPEFSGQYCQRIFTEGISGMRVLHICGDTNHLVLEMEKTGADGLSLDKHVPLPQAYDTLRHETVLIGNIDPVSVLTFRTAAEVKSSCRELVQAMQGKKNFILSSGCDIPQLAPIENIKALVSSARP
ncbi:MAG: uroporphyrinogen decarboxylase family protein [Deltaproteobacteria bacterium]